jgi:ABC-type branched-subunit amino acid transport system permease subunit
LPLNLNILVAIAVAVLLCMRLENTPWGRAEAP